MEMIGFQSDVTNVSASDLTNIRPDIMVTIQGDDSLESATAYLRALPNLRVVAVDREGRSARCFRAVTKAELNGTVNLDQDFIEVVDVELDTERLTQVIRGIYQ